MARVKGVFVRGFKSVRDECYIEVPLGVPLILIGENNAGKSNIVRALDVVLGESWPASRDVLDHDCWGRDLSGQDIDIAIQTEGLIGRSGADVERLLWRYRPRQDEAVTLREVTADGEHYTNNAARQKVQAIVVGADRRLSHQLSYASKWTLLSKLMRHFHTRMMANPEVAERLKAEFSRIVAIFDEVAEYKQFLEELKEQLGAMQAGMTYALSVDPSAYDPSNFFHSLRFMPTESGEVRAFEELGTGQEQVLALVFAHAYARAFYEGLVLVIEEPEAHLHPLAQLWLARTIRRMAADGLQLVITTHSPAFVDVLGLEGVVVVRKLEGATRVRQMTAADLAEYCVDHGADARRATADRILPYYASAATTEIMAGLFSRAVVLVEGPTEAAALPVLLTRVGLDTVLAGIAVVPVLGKGSLAKWWRFFSAFDFPAYVVFDNDPRDDAHGKKREDILRTMEVPDGEMPRLVGTADWIIEERWSIFGADFERTLREKFADYERLEAEALEELGGDSKPLVAKYVAERLDLEAESEGREDLKALAEQVKKLVG